MTKRYLYEVGDIYSYDRQALLNELKAAKVPVLEVHVGNGTLVFDAEIELDFALKTALATVLANHSPVWFKWANGRHTFRRIVRCKEDVDKITAERIRGHYGGDDPAQEQLKSLREFVTALDIQQNPSQYSPWQIAGAAQSRVEGRVLNDEIEAIREAGRFLKVAEGWEV